VVKNAHERKEDRHPCFGVGCDSAIVLDDIGRAEVLVDRGGSDENWVKGEEQLDEGGCSIACKVIEFFL
jgi:hypothetical protein